MDDHHHCHNEQPICIRLKKKKQKTKKKLDPKKFFKGMKRVPKVKIKRATSSAEAIFGHLRHK